MKHGTVVKAEPTTRLPDFPDVRHLFGTLPGWLMPFEHMKL